MNPRENTLRAIRFETPGYIPMCFHINPACWNHYDPHALQDLMAEHSFLFPDFNPQQKILPRLLPNQRKNQPYTDPWNCEWITAEDGITGSVHNHPLADWSAWEHFQSPDPNQTDGTYPVRWNDIRASVLQQKNNNQLVCGGLPHGHTFLRLQDLRGYENLLFDMIDEDPRLLGLIEQVADFNYQVVLRWMELDPDIMSYPEDLGMQTGPMISPDMFRKYIQPVYRRIMKPARDHGCLVHMHSDGDIRTLADDLLEGGVHVLNLQDLVNGMDWIREHLTGRFCIELDIDRQQITPYGTPDQIDALIQNEVKKLGSPQGGLMMIYGLYPGIPLQNVKALMDAMEKYAFLYS